MNLKLLEFTTELIKTMPCKSVDEIKGYFEERNKELSKILNRENIPAHLSGLSPREALLKITGNPVIHSVLVIGANEALMQDNMRLLNNVIFTYNRIETARSLLFNTGTDHSSGWFLALKLFACMDIKSVYRIYPEEKGLSCEGDSFTIACSNLIISFLYKNTDWLKKSSDQAYSVLSQKQPQFYHAIIELLLAVKEQNFQAVNRNMLQACKFYGKTKAIHDFKNPLYKKFGLIIHGLYNLAFHFLPKEIYENITYPDTNIFIKEYADFQKKNNYPAGTPYFLFEKELEKLNDIFF